MDYATAKITWRCNGCGAKFDTPETCPTCHTSVCPECKRVGCLQNMIETERARSHGYEFGQMNRPKKTEVKREKKIKDPEAEQRRLMELIRS